MKLLIDISENYYEILKHEVEVNHYDYLPFILIAKGIPLPKGHGDLVDAKEVYKKFYCRCLAGVATEVLNETSIIIEADKESEDDNN